MDGVLADFIDSALKALNRDFGKNVTQEQYATFGKWETYDYYGITTKEFWHSIDSTEMFWYNIKPYPWAKELYDYLSNIGEVTILTAPNLSLSCVPEKLVWLEKHLNIKSDKVMLGNRKYLMAGNGILIDDYSKNVDTFIKAGGEAILVPALWNTNGLTFDMVRNTIDEGLIYYYYGADADKYNR